VRRVIGIVIAGLLASCAPKAAQYGAHWTHKLVKTEIGSEHRVRLGDLVGLPPEEVGQKLTGQAVRWPTPMGLEMASPQGTMTFANLDEWMSDEAGHEIGRRGADDSDFKPDAFSSCRANFTDTKDAPTVFAFSIEDGKVKKSLEKERSAGDLTLEFVNGRFTQAWSIPDQPATQSGPTLEDGATFTSRWARRPLSADVTLSIQCWRHTPVRQLALGRKPLPDVAGNLQGLALLPFALELPSLNARRATALRDGAMVYDQLAPGAEIPGGVEAFAAKHPVIAVRPGPDPHYVLLQVDLGAYPSRNLTYFHHEALIGVRDGRVLFRTRRGRDAIQGLSAERELPAKDRGFANPLVVG
jgi:hypothetical protein